MSETTHVPTTLPECFKALKHRTQTVVPEYLKCWVYWYGPAFSGKTSLAAAQPRTAIVDAQAGSSFAKLGRGSAVFPVGNWKDVLSVTSALLADSGKTFDCVVADPIGRLRTFAEDYLNAECAREQIEKHQRMRLPGECRPKTGPQKHGHNWQNMINLAVLAPFFKLKAECGIGGRILGHTSSWNEERETFDGKEVEVIVKPSQSQGLHEQLCRECDFAWQIVAIQQVESGVPETGKAASKVLAAAAPGSNDFLTVRTRPRDMTAASWTRDQGSRILLPSEFRVSRLNSYTDIVRIYNAAVEQHLKTSDTATSQ